MKKKDIFGVLTACVVTQVGYLLFRHMGDFQYPFALFWGWVVMFSTHMIRLKLGDR